MSGHPVHLNDAAHDEVLSWLLTGDPAIVWQVQRDLMDLPIGTWSKTRGRVTRETRAASSCSPTASTARTGPGRWSIPR